MAPDTKKESPARKRRRKVIDRAQEEAVQNITMRDGFAQWVLDRTSELEAIQDALLPGAPLDVAFHEDAHKVACRVNAAIEAFDSLHRELQPRLTPYFLLFPSRKPV